mmetsp:Transcript_27185/g.41982  ORF Transcript_27185/g.41982 Transcript_27185/m.41982 type:complete len:404 (-) Transcript_27185:114-1325(-)
MWPGRHLKISTSSLKNDCTGDGRAEFLGGGHVVLDGIGELLGKVRVGCGPGGVGSLPLVVGGLVFVLDALEKVLGSGTDEPLLVGKSESLTGTVHVRDAGLSVSSVGSLDLLDSLADDGVAFDELGLSVFGGLRRGEGLLNGIEVVSVDLVCLPSVGFVPGDDVLALRVLRHFGEGDFVGVVHDDEVVELLVGRETGSLRGDSLLEASVAGKGEDVVSEDLVVCGVVDGLRHLLGKGEADGVGNSLSEGSGGGLDSGGGVFAIGELRVAGSHGVVLTEVLHLLEGKIVTGDVQPAVNEHGSVAGGQDEAVAVDPGRVGRVVGHRGSVKGGTDLGSAKGKTHVAGFGGGDGVHSKTTCLVGGGGERCLSIDNCGHVQLGRRTCGDAKSGIPEGGTGEAHHGAGH